MPGPACLLLTLNSDIVAATGLLSLGSMMLGFGFEQSWSFGEEMHRRGFMALLAGAATGWPVVARTQQSTMPVIGFLNAGSAQNYAPSSAAFLKVLVRQAMLRAAISLSNIAGPMTRMNAL